MLSNNWFVVPKPLTNPKLRLVCFPYAGGGAQTYVSWADKLPEGVELVAIQPPGRANRIAEKPFSDMDKLISALISQMQSVKDVPYVLFGHSLGSKVAYELSATMQRLGQVNASHLIVSGSGSPGVASQEAPLYLLNDEEFIDKLSELNGTPREILENRELMSLLAPLIRADFKISDTYQPNGPLVDCPISILGGIDDADVTDELLQAWNELTTRPGRVHKFPGDHFFIEQHVDKVVQTVNDILFSVLQNLERPSYVGEQVAKENEAA